MAFKYDVPELKCQHLGFAFTLVLTFRPWDIIFACCT